MENHVTKPIPIAGPWITQTEIDSVTDAVTNGWYDQANVYQERFEAAFADYVGRRHAIALPSCTSALHLALLSLGLQPGDEVIVPEITWIASAAPITYVNATPVFADIDPTTWCLSAESLESRITSRTKAVIIVDLYGNLPNMKALCAIAKQHGLVVIEDAAQAIGSEYQGQKAGSFGDISVFSFHGSKTLSCGEGGMLVTDSPEWIERCRILSNHGQAAGDKPYWNRHIGYKYKMSSMQAALGLAQLSRIDALVDKKRQIFEWYRQQLADCPEIQLNPESGGVKNTYWLVTALLNNRLQLPKEIAAEFLRERQIDTRPFFYPLSSLPAFAHLPQAQTAHKQNTHAYALSPFGINLPSHMQLTADTVDVVCNSMRQLIKSHLIKAGS